MRTLRLPAALAAVALIATACSDEGGDSGSSGYPRNETLYTTGTAWDPPTNWNPIMRGQYAVGTFGLAYEPLFHYDAEANDYVHWLAESDEWPDESTHVITLRDGMTWTDGEAIDAEDVVTTIELGQMDVFYSNIWDYVEGVEATGDLEVTVTFSDPRPQEWMNWAFGTPIVPEHIWADKSQEELTDDPNAEPVGSGPYVYEAHADDRMVWKRNDDWWGAEAHGLEMQPTYIVDVVNASNEVTMNMLSNGEVDLSNNFLPGIEQSIDAGQLTSFYDGPPYMQSANTAWLVVNHDHPALGDAEFRKALAHAIDLDQIISGPYSDLVDGANPTGLLPQWDAYIDHELVEEEGHTYNPDESVALLEDAGYMDDDGDGYVETPDGEPISLTLEVPGGWSDWEEAARVIAENAQEVGIDIQTNFPDFGLLVDNRNAGEFDIVINNERQLSNTPWSYYDYLFQLPVRDSQTTVNFGRYENEEAWELVEELATVPADDVEGAAEVTSRIQEIQLAELPAIPLWYNGLWSQQSNDVWTNWPSESGYSGYATMWDGWFQLGAIRTLAEIELAE